MKLKCVVKKHLLLLSVQLKYVTWRWGQEVSLEHSHISTALKGVTSHVLRSIRFHTATSLNYYTKVCCFPFSVWNTKCNMHCHSSSYFSEKPSPVIPIIWLEMCQITSLDVWIYICRWRINLISWDNKTCSRARTSAAYCGEGSALNTTAKSGCITASTSSSTRDKLCTETLCLHYHVYLKPTNLKLFSILSHLQTNNSAL
jgi:hypothetical protein